MSFLYGIREMKRRWFQFFSTLLHNSYSGFLITHNIYTGFLKNFCAPGLNCYSCPERTLTEAKKFCKIPKGQAKELAGQE